MKFTILLKSSLGVLALILSAIGLFLPVWPTTPFVLIAVGCFSSTPKVQKKLLNISYIREYYDSYTSGKGIRRGTVAGSLVFLWVMLAISMILAGKLWITALLLVVGIAVTVHILVLSKDRPGKMNTNWENKS